MRPRSGPLALVLGWLLIAVLLLLAARAVLEALAR